VAKASSEKKPAVTTESRWAQVQPWLSLLVRLALGVIALWAAIPKILDLQQSQLAVGAYDIFSPGLTQLIGYALPFIELVIGLLFLAGLLTRYVSVVWGLLMVVFIAGIISAWARGLNIDCGCFNPGGVNPDVDGTTYFIEILRDIGFIAMGAFLVIWPWSKYSVDKQLDLEPDKRSS
jgi:uncharacterized membrane protein YphA (DoxX/SURF4 family)